MVGDLTGGLPFEVWKSTVLLEVRRAHASGEKPLSSLGCLSRLVKTRGAAALWSGCSARMLEGALSGGVLLAGSQAIRGCLSHTSMSPLLVAFAAGAGGGACQAVVMAPCSMMVTSATSEGGSLPEVARRMWKRGGLRGIYTGSGAVAMRQATNWASRQGFTEFARPFIKVPGAPGEVLAGLVGGLLATWNTPFEVARIEMQASLLPTTRLQSAKNGEPARGKASQTQVNPTTLFGTLSSIRKERGFGGLYAGLGPRIGQGCYMTVFMVVVPKLMDGVPK